MGSTSANGPVRTGLDGALSIMAENAVDRQLPLGGAYDLIAYNVRIGHQVTAPRVVEILASYGWIKVCGETVHMLKSPEEILRRLSSKVG